MLLPPWRWSGCRAQQQLRGEGCGSWATLAAFRNQNVIIKIILQPPWRHLGLLISPRGLWLPAFGGSALQRGAEVLALAWQVWEQMRRDEICRAWALLWTGQLCHCLSPWAGRECPVQATGETGLLWESGEMREEGEWEMTGIGNSSGKGMRNYNRLGRGRQGGGSDPSWK